MKIGKIISEARKEKGYSQEYLAKKIFVSRNTLWRYENDLMDPGYQTLILLIKYLNIPIDKLLPFSNHKKTQEEIFLELFRKEKELYQKALRNPKTFIKNLKIRNEKKKKTYT